MAYLTDDFHASDWTDQEGGYVMSRPRMVVPVRVDRNPYGFMDNYQAMPNQASSMELARQVCDALYRYEPTRAHIARALTRRLDESWSYADARANWKRVREIPFELWDEDMRQQLVADGDNRQVLECIYERQPLPDLIRRFPDEITPL